MEPSLTEDYYEYWIQIIQRYFDEDGPFDQVVWLGLAMALLRYAQLPASLNKNAIKVIFGREKRIDLHHPLNRFDTMLADNWQSMPWILQIVARLEPRL